MKRCPQPLPGQRTTRHRLSIVAILVLIITLGHAMAASCPYCGQVYGEPAPGDEARVYALRAEHEASCPARYRGTQQGGTTQGYSDSYGVVTIYNQTSQPVTYQMQTRAWGGWQRATVQPGRSYFHWQSLPASFKLRISTGFLRGRTYDLAYNTITGREPTAADGRPFVISGNAGDLTLAPGVTSPQGKQKPRLSQNACQCRGQSTCRCLWDTCGPNGAWKCGCGGHADCDCPGLRCPKFANTTACTGSIYCRVDGKHHCNRHGCPDGEGGPPQAGSAPALFAGSWSGTIKLGIHGNLNLRLDVSRDASSVFESGGVLDARHAAKIAGDSLIWRTGILNEISWTLTPARDGRRASVIARSPLGIDYTATFERD